MAIDLSKLTSLLKFTPKKGDDRTVVGVDIGASSIKVVQLRKKHGVPTLETYGELQLGPYGDVEIGRTINLPVSKATEALVDIVRESSVTAQRVALSISYASSFVTNISVAAKSEEQISSMVPIEARKYIPVHLNDVSIDWFPISYDAKTNKTMLLLAAIHNESLNKSKIIISNAGLKSGVIEIELFSSIRSSIAPEDKNVAIIDLGASSTKLYIVNNGVISRTHSTRMSGIELTSALSEALSTTFDKAEVVKRRSGLSDNTNPRVEKALKQVLERGFREVHKVIERHVQDENLTVDKVVLTGGGALMRGIDVYAQDIFQRTVVRAKPFSKVSFPAFLEDTLKNAGPLFSVSIGAALRALDEE